jgi:hypothetical protein
MALALSFDLRRRVAAWPRAGCSAAPQRADVRRRLACFEAQPELERERLVFIDETGASTMMAKCYGRARRQERCRAPVPHGHLMTASFVGARRQDRMTAPIVLDGPMNGAAVQAAGYDFA